MYVLTKTINTTKMNKINSTRTEAKIGDEVFIMGGAPITYHITNIDEDGAIITNFHPKFRVHRISIILKRCKKEMDSICVTEEY